MSDPNAWLDILGLAKSYGKGKGKKKRKISERVKTLPKHLQRRPKWRKKTIQALEKTAINGKFYDAKIGKEIKGKKVIGHLNQTWKEYQEANRSNKNLTRKQVIYDYNNINNLGYEDATQSSIDGGKFKGLEN